MEQAAAVRWFLARARSQAARPHELLEYQAAEAILEALECRYPGLREFVVEATEVAIVAAALAVAKGSNVPGDVVEELACAAEQGWEGLRFRAKAISVENFELLLQSYAELADMAGIVAT